MLIAGAVEPSRNTTNTQAKSADTIAGTATAGNASTGDTTASGVVEDQSTDGVLTFGGRCSKIIGALIWGFVGAVVFLIGCFLCMSCCAWYWYYAGEAEEPLKDPDAE